MRWTFVDTAGWLAFANSDDALHAGARQVMRRLRLEGTRLLTTEFVLIEMADALASSRTRRHAVDFIDGLRHWSMLEIAPASSHLLGEGWDLYSRRPDKDWSLTDCISFAVMTDRGIAQAFTSDHHFEQAGFGILL
jgi:predicted nucleic acid-binding protein